jgi:hypothetical protein
MPGEVTANRQKIGAMLWGDDRKRPLVMVVGSATQICFYTADSCRTDGSFPGPPDMGIRILRSGGDQRAGGPSEGVRREDAGATGEFLLL